MPFALSGHMVAGCPQNSWVDFPSSQLLEDDRFVVIEQDSVFDVPANGAREHHLFQVAALLDEITQRIAVRDPGYTLLDDRAIIQYFRDVVSGGANQFYAALVSLVMRLCAHEGGQERVVNVDDGLRELHDEVGGKHLHVAGKDHDVDVVSMQQFQLLCFGLRLVLFGDGNVMEGDTVKIGVAFRVQMAADDQRKIALEFSAALAIQQIHQPVIKLGNEDGHPRAVIAQGDAPVHAELVRNRAKRPVEVLHVQAEPVEVPFDTRQVVALFAGLMLFEIKNISIVAVDKFGDGGVQAFALWALQEKNGA